ncbi:restriction endonuclease subunit S [Fibrobacter sp. UWCM]|uniref:restriction endonuclease subunit S n=1 Tax=Fibrobacter sp. UWCM TaxID=1896208 RepID=UPI0009326497|nr:restriction endonuclease subunit S [Fibrobacter sp. UWCM]
MKRNWKYLSIGECFPSIKNGANIKQIAGANGYPITRIETLSGGIFNRDRMGYANIVDLTKYQDYILESGDLLLSHINSKAYIGRTVKYEKQGDEKIIHGMNLLRLRANPEVISSSLFAYYSKSMKFKDAVARIRKDAVNQSSMAISDLRKIVVPVPPLDEQSRIVAELDLLTGIIDKQNAQLKELDNLAQTIFYDMFGDPIENPKRWEVKKLGDVSTSVSYGTSSPSSTVGKYKYLRMNNITYEGFLDLTDLKYIDMDDAEFEKYSVREGDVLFNRTNSMDLIGKTTYIHNMEPMIIAGYIIRVRLVDSVLPVYVSKFMNMPAMKKKLKGMAKGAVNQANINSKELKSIDIPLPPLALQQSFAEKIQSIEKQKETIRASIVDTQKLLDYTMDKYFG